MKDTQKQTKQDYYLNAEDIRLMLDILEFRFQMADLSTDEYEDRYLAEDLYVYLKRMYLEALK